jgi:hypothetical protein
MVRPTQNNLLALLLALKDLDQPLSDAEQANLEQVGQQLYLAPDDWEFIEKSLKQVIEGNDSLNQRYQIAKTKLDAMAGDFPADLFPTETELKAELAMANFPEKRGFKPGKPSQDDNEAIINNVVVPVLRDDNPPDRAKNLSFLDRLQNHIPEKSS